MCCRPPFPEDVPKSAVWYCQTEKSFTSSPSEDRVLFYSSYFFIFGGDKPPRMPVEEVFPHTVATVHRRRLQVLTLTPLRVNSTSGERGPGNGSEMQLTSGAFTCPLIRRDYEAHLWKEKGVVHSLIHSSALMHVFHPPIRKFRKIGSASHIHNTSQSLFVWFPDWVGFEIIKGSIAK